MSRAIADESKHAVLAADQTSMDWLVPYTDLLKANNVPLLMPQMFDRTFEEGAHVLIVSDIAHLDRVVPLLAPFAGKVACGVLLRVPPGVDPSAFLDANAYLRTALGNQAPQMLAAANEKQLRRFVFAWANREEKNLIGAARVQDRKLWVTRCSVDVFVVPLDAIPALRDATTEDLAEIEVDSTGFEIYWPKLDVTIDLDYVCYLADEELRKRVDDRSRKYDEVVGAAIRAIRERNNLTQQEVSGGAGISLKQVGRLERGEHHARPSTLAQIATAHGMTEDAYLKELYQLVAEMTR